MCLPRFLSLTLIAAVFRAHPVFSSPSRAFRCEPPTPSAYPLDRPCNHEWQYLNFNPEDASDRARLEKLHDIICNEDLHAVWSSGDQSAQDILDPNNRYFPFSDENIFEVHVRDILHWIAGRTSGAGVGTYVVDNFDYAINNPNPNKHDCTAENTFAYTLPNENDSRAKIHFCEYAWTRTRAATTTTTTTTTYEDGIALDFLRDID